MPSSFKLYYSPTSCGAANFITASLAGLDFESEQVDLMDHKTASGADYYKINPKGNIPAIVFPDGTILNENVATLTFLADQNPSAGLAPPSGTPARYAHLNNMGFIATEMHKAFGALFMPADDDAKSKLRARAVVVAKNFTDLVLKDATFLGGDKPSAADIYAYIVLSWGSYVGVDLSSNPRVAEYSARVKSHPGVEEAQAKMESAQ